MTRRALFEVGGVLLGVYFVVVGFGSLPSIFAYLHLEGLDITSRLLMRLDPFIYLVAGFFLIFKSRACAAWFFPAGETVARSSDQSLRLCKYFELGVRLLGLYFTLHYLPYAGRFVNELVDKGIDGTNMRGWFATILVLIISLFLLLKGDWLARLLLADEEISNTEPTSAEDRDREQNPMNEKKLVEVYRAKNVPQAVLLRQTLEDEGIRAAIDNDFLQGAVGELPTGWSTAPRIIVARDDAPQAREIIERWERTEIPVAADARQAADIVLCLACGSQIPSGVDRCRACGWSYKTREPDEEAP